MFIPTAEIAAIWWLHGKNNIFVLLGQTFLLHLFVPNTQLNVVQFLFVQIWPICGGKNLAPPPKHQELLLTGYLRKTHTHTNTQTLRHTHTQNTLKKSALPVHFLFILTKTWCFRVIYGTSSCQEMILNRTTWKDWIGLDVPCTETRTCRLVLSTVPELLFNDLVLRQYDQRLKNNRLISRL